MSGPDPLSATTSEVAAFKLPGRPRTVRTRRRRVHLDLLQDIYTRVVAVQRVNGLDSPRAVFREAFRIYEFCTKRRLEGWSIQLVDPAGSVRAVELFGDLIVPDGAPRTIAGDAAARNVADISTEMVEKDTRLSDDFAQSPGLGDDESGPARNIRSTRP